MNRKQLNHRVRAFAHGTLKLSEEAYREVIRDVTADKEHITDCTDDEAQLVLTALRRFHVMRLNVPGRPPTPEALSTRRSPGAANRDAGGERQHSMIPRLMDFLRWDWKSTAGFCEKVIGKKDTRQCDAKELSKMIRGMVAVIEHDLARGKITMTPEQLATFRRHTAHKMETEERRQETGSVCGLPSPVSSHSHTNGGNR